VTGRDTQLGYRLGYCWSEKGDFELEMGVFSAEGGLCRGFQNGVRKGSPTAALRCNRAQVFWCQFAIGRRNLPLVALIAPKFAQFLRERDCQSATRPAVLNLGDPGSRRIMRWTQACKSVREPAPEVPKSGASAQSGSDELGRAHPRSHGWRVAGGSPSRALRMRSSPGSTDSGKLSLQAITPFASMTNSERLGACTCTSNAP